MERGRGVGVGSWTALEPSTGIASKRRIISLLFNSLTSLFCEQIFYATILCC